MVILGSETVSWRVDSYRGYARRVLCRVADTNMWRKIHYDPGISRICGEASPVASRAMPDLAPDFSAGMNLAVLYINGKNGKTNAGGKVLGYKEVLQLLLQATRLNSCSSQCVHGFI